jgi:hypothetical protein
MAAQTSCWLTKQSFLDRLDSELEKAYWKISSRSQVPNLTPCKTSLWSAHPTPLLPQGSHVVTTTIFYEPEAFFR